MTTLEYEAFSAYMRRVLAGGGQPQQPSARLADADGVTDFKAWQRRKGVG